MYLDQEAVTKQIGRLDRPKQVIQPSASTRLKNLLADTRSQYARVRLLLIAVRVLLVLFAFIVIAALVLCSVPSLQQHLPYLSKQPEKNAAAVSPGDATPLPRSELSDGKAEQATGNKDTNADKPNPTPSSEPD